MFDNQYKLLNNGDSTGTYMGYDPITGERHLYNIEYEGNYSISVPGYDPINGDFVHTSYDMADYLNEDINLINNFDVKSNNESLEDKYKKYYKYDGNEPYNKEFDNLNFEEKQEVILAGLIGIIMDHSSKINNIDSRLDRIENLLNK